MLALDDAALARLCIGATAVSQRQRRIRFQGQSGRHFLTGRVAPEWLYFFTMERAPRNLAPSLWVIDRPFTLPYVGAEIGTRMTCVRLADGRLFLHSPVKLDPVLRNSLDALGEVRAIVAPNKLHHLFVAEYVRSYPRAGAYSAPRLSKKRPDLPFTGELGDEPRTEWRGQIEQHLFRGAPALNEVVFFHPATRTLILTD